MEHEPEPSMSKDEKESYAPFACFLSDLACCVGLSLTLTFGFSSGSNSRMASRWNLPSDLVDSWMSSCRRFSSSISSSAVSAAMAADETIVAPRLDISATSKTPVLRSALDALSKLFTDAPEGVAGLAGLIGAAGRAPDWGLSESGAGRLAPGVPPPVCLTGISGVEGLAHPLFDAVGCR